MKLMTEIPCPKSRIQITYEDKITIIGSCFADTVGSRMKSAGFQCQVNPFGTLYNPASIMNGILRLEDGSHFSPDDCIEMGAGAGLICSFHHHTSFARPTAEEFLENANRKLDVASTFWHESKKVIITLGTIYCFNRSGKTVSNCLKRPASEFERVPLSLCKTEEILNGMIQKWPEKEFIFTVSPIRHLADGAHGNQISKSTLLLALHQLEGKENVEYFPAYEIVLDELRDYRFFAEDMVHPTAQTAGYIWERFIEFAIPSSEHERIRKEEKSAKSSLHRSNLYRTED